MTIVLTTAGFEDFKKLAESVEAEFIDIKPSLIEIVDRKKRTRLIEVLIEKRFEIWVKFEGGYEPLETAHQLGNQPWSRLRCGIFESVWDGSCDSSTGSVWICTLDDLPKSRLKGAGGRKALKDQKLYWLNELNMGKGMTASEVRRALVDAGYEDVSDKTIQRWKMEFRTQ